MIEIEYNGPKETSAAETFAAAEEQIAQQYPAAVYCEQWETYGLDGSRERLLVWADQEAAAGPDGMGDGGQNAVAQIVREV